MRESSRSRPAAIAMVLACGLAVAACGQGDDPLGGDAIRAFAAALDPVPLNAEVAGDVSGTAAFLIGEDGNVFVAGVDAAPVSAGVHPQYVHAGDACPTAEQDADGDGFISAAEGAAVYGGILLPLDTDLTAQAAGEFPTAGGDNVYDYERSAALDAVLASIRGQDADEFVELGPEEALDLADRVVVVHGVSDDADLPPGLDNATLPIACAEIAPQEAG